MGALPTRESLLLEKPWRDVPWRNKKKDLNYMKKFKPSKAKHLRVLLHGPTGSGKSSFINSVDSALRGRIAVRASTATIYDSSFTKEYRSYQIQKEKPGTFYPIVFSDTMGIEKGSGRGIDVNNLKLIMEGHVKDGFLLLPGTKPKDATYRKNPTINDKVHVLVCVIDATTVNQMYSHYADKFRDVREEARFLGIPQVVVLTKIDEACPEVSKNVKNAYRSRYLKEQVDKLSSILGFPLNCIFLVKNYTDETSRDDDTDTLILDTMRKIVDYGQDFLNDGKNVKKIENK